MSLKTQLLIIIDRTDATGIPKTVLRIEHKILHGAVGDTEFEDAVRSLLRAKFVKSTIESLTGDTRYFATAAGTKALGH